MNYENLDKATININGCCVLRDIFGIREDAKSTNYKIINFRQFSSPITWFIMNDKPQECIELEQLQNLTVDGLLKNNFTKKCVVDDYNKNVLQSYTCKSDYFLLDFAEARYGIVNLVSKDGQKHCFTATGRITKKNKDGICFLDLLQGEKVIDSYQKYDNAYNIHKTCELLVEWLINKMGYKESDIILVETQSALVYTDGKEMYEFPNKEKIISENIYIKKWNDKFKELTPNCNVIKLPDELLADTRNKWGLHSLHYCREVYDYLYEAVNVIINKDNYNSIEYYRNRCMTLIRDKMEYYNKNKELKKVMIEYERALNGLKISENGLDNISDCRLSDICVYVDKLKRDINRAINSPYLVVDYHMSKEGWLSQNGIDVVCNGSLNHWIEAVKMKIESVDTLHINYAVRLKNSKSFTNVYSDGKMSGTTGRSIPIIGIKIWLTGETATEYGIAYEIFGDSENKKGKDGQEVILDYEIIKKICIEII